MPTVDSTTDDRALIAAVQRGDVHAFRCFHDRHRAWARRLAFKILDDAELAEEAVQEAFVSLWTSARSYDGTRGAPAVWLSGIVRNRAVDYWRQERCRPARALDCTHRFAALSSADNLEAQTIAGELNNTIRAQVAGLPERQREVVELGFYGEFSHAEIAHRLGVPLGTAKGRMRHGLGRLRVSLASET